MSDPHDMLPIIRQMHEADGDGERARILLSVPDKTLLKYRGAFVQACRRAQFELGETYVLLRDNAMGMVRDHHGNLPKDRALALREVRTAMIALSEGQGE
ncbi:MAG: hypothetical protein M9944_07935 [Rhizobiaceae bacterium]|nr:hypothetical protein [Rhizobiaceae bacterium]